MASSSAIAVGILVSRSCIPLMDGAYLAQRLIWKAASMRSLCEVWGSAILFRSLRSAARPSENKRVTAIYLSGVYELSGGEIHEAKLTKP